MAQAIIGLPGEAPRSITYNRIIFLSNKKILPMNTKKLESSLKRHARRLRLSLTGVLALAALFLAVGLYAEMALLLGHGSGISPMALRFGDVGWPDWWTLCLAGSVVLFALSRLVHMLKCIESGQIFTRETTGDLRQFATWMLVATLLWTFLPAAVRIACGLIGVPARQNVIELDGSQFLMVLVSVVLFFVARLLDAAQRLADDHRQII